MADVIRIHGLVNDSIVDGPGLRLAVFTQGCPHACLGCHNLDSHDPAGGSDMPIAEIVSRVQKNPLLSGVTLTGGDPLWQAQACLDLVCTLPEGTDVWLYTGWTWEEIMQGTDVTQRALVERCHVLVDGRYVQEERSLALRFRGSRNQRIIDIPKSLEAGQPVLWEKG